jgi:hypothetical protein
LTKEGGFLGGGGGGDRQNNFCSNGQRKLDAEREREREGRCLNLRKRSAATIDLQYKREGSISLPVATTMIALGTVSTKEGVLLRIFSPF